MVENMSFPELIEDVLSGEENNGRKLSSEEIIETLFQKFWNGDNIWLRQKWKSFTEHESNSMMFDLKTGFRNFKNEMRKELEEGFTKELEERNIFKAIEGEVCYLGSEESLQEGVEKEKQEAVAENPVEFEGMDEAHRTGSEETGATKEIKEEPCPTEVEKMRREAEELWDEAHKEAEETEYTSREQEELEETLNVQKTEVREEDMEEEISEVEKMRREAEELWDEAHEEAEETETASISEEELEELMITQETEGREGLTEYAEMPDEQETLETETANTSRTYIEEIEEIAEGLTEQEAVEAATMIDEARGETPTLEEETGDAGECRRGMNTLSVIEDTPLKVATKPVLPYNVPLTLEDRGLDSIGFGLGMNTPIQEAMKNFGIEVGRDFRMKSPEQKRQGEKKTEVSMMPEEAEKLENHAFDAEVVADRENVLPILVKFLREDEHFRMYSKSIDNSCNEWDYPSMVAIGEEIDTQSVDNTLNEFMKVSGQYPPRIFSFEVQGDIAAENVRESFFKAVSNTSWAHEGYLVISSIEEDFEGNSRRELKRLSATFGVGVIILDLEDPDMTEILSLGERREQIDMDSVSRLLTVSENRDFQEFIETVNETNRTENVEIEKFDRVMSNNEILEFVKEKFGM